MKKSLFSATFVLVTAILFSLMAMESHAATTSATKYQLSTHILDVTLGRPAPGVTIALFRLDQDGQSWQKIAQAVTDRNGRIGTFLPETQSNRGIYKLQFQTKEYFRKQNLQSIYPFVEVVFEIADDLHYHIPITLSANGYGTYRGN